ncbi:MAG: hypothetical protein R6U31_00615, partial [bacterium]
GPVVASSACLKDIREAFSVAPIHSFPHHALRNTHHDIWLAIRMTINHQPSTLDPASSRYYFSPALIPSFTFYLWAFTFLILPAYPKSS